MNDRIFISVVGYEHYYGNNVFSIDSIVTLKKEPLNPYDKEAIAVITQGHGISGYVANKPNTVLRGTKRASRIYDVFGNECKAKVCYSSFDNVICELILDTALNKGAVFEYDEICLKIENLTPDKYLISCYNNGYSFSTEIEFKDSFFSQVDECFEKRKNCDIKVSDKVEFQFEFNNNVVFIMKIREANFEFTVKIEDDLKKVKIFFDYAAGLEKTRIL